MIFLADVPVLLDSILLDLIDWKDAVVLSHHSHRLFDWLYFKTLFFFSSLCEWIYWIEWAFPTK